MSQERYKYGQGNFDDYDLIEVIDDTKENKDYVNMEEIAKILNEQDQKIKELEHRLSNCIEPKFKVGQKVWFIDGKIVCGEVEEFDYVVSKYKEFYNYFIDGYGWLLQKQLFATEEEAKAKLREMKNG